MRNKAILFFMLTFGSIYAQNCPLPEYRFRGGEGQESILNMSAIYHLGGGDCSSFGGGYSICHSGMAFGMMPGMHKNQTQLNNNHYEFKKIGCSKYLFYYPVDSMYDLDTNRYSAYKGHSRDWDYKSFPFMITVMDIQLLFDRDTLVSMTLWVPAYGDYNKELIQALGNEFNFRYGAPIDSLMNEKLPNPDYTKNTRVWSSNFCNQQKTIRIHQYYNIRDNKGEELVVEFVKDRFKSN